MKSMLRILAGGVAGLTLAVWLVTGAHTGWTKTSKVTIKTDPVTELDYPESEPAFIAGVEVVGAGMMLALLLACGSLFCRNQPQHKPS